MVWTRFFNDGTETSAAFLLLKNFIVEITLTALIQNSSCWLAWVNPPLRGFVEGAIFELLFRLSKRVSRNSNNSAVSSASGGMPVFSSLPKKFKSVVYIIFCLKKKRIYCICCMYICILFL